MAADPKLVVALEARLDRFEKQMKDAGVIAERGVKDIEDKFSRANPAIGAGAVFGGTLLASAFTAGLKQAGSFIEGIIERFKELQQVAKLAGASMQEVFGLQEAGRKFNVPIEEMTSGIRNLSNLLNQAGRGEENSLTRLFEGNKISLRDANGEMITLQAALKIVADLVQNANTQWDKIDWARAAGFTEKAVPALQKGGEALGVIADKAAAAAPDLDKMALVAKELEKALRDAGAAIQRWALTEGFEGLKSQLLSLLAIVEKMISVFQGPLIKDWTDRKLAEIAEVRKAIQELGAVSKTDAATPERVGRQGGNRAGGGTDTLDPNRPITRPPATGGGGGDTKDAFDRQEESIRKHIAAMNADAEAVGKTVGEHARLRAEAALLEAANRAGIEVNDAYAERIKKIADAAGQAADALNKRKEDFKAFNDALKFGGNQFVDVLDGILSGTQTFAQGMQNALSAVRRALLQALITGQGPLAGILGMSSGVPGGTGGLFGLLGGAFGGARAAGGPVDPGHVYRVGERGPEMFVPKTAGVIIPNGVRGSTGGGPIVIQNTISADGADSAQLARVVSAVQQLNITQQRQARALQSSSRYQSTGVM